MIATCPNCQKELKVADIPFLEEPNWEFWGKAGNRWIIHQEGGFIHFKVKLDNGKYHERGAYENYKRDD